MREGGRLRPTTGLQATLGGTELEVLRVDAEGLVARVVTPRSAGSYPAAVRASASTWEGPSFAVTPVPERDAAPPVDAAPPPVDLGPPDSGPEDMGPPDAPEDVGVPDAALDAGPPPDAVPTEVVVATDGVAARLPGVDLPGRCEADPAVTPDGRFLLLAEPIGVLCTGDRRFRVLGWNEGMPVDTGDVVANDDVASLHLLSGEVRGAPGDYVVVAAINDALFEATLEGETPVTVGTSRRILRDAGAPSLTADGELLFYEDGGRLYERTDPFGTGEPTRELRELEGIDRRDPAISADGRVLVYSAQDGVFGDDDLYLATRLSRDDPFEPPERLARGGDRFNTGAQEVDAYLTAEGDLLFTSTRDSFDRRVYIVRRFYVP